MSNAQYTALISRQNVAKALRDARAKCATSPAWLTAVNKAALELEVGQWAFDGETLKIASRTTSGMYYTTTEQTCQCAAHQAGRPCWHRAAVRLLVKAAQMAQDEQKRGEVVLAASKFVALTAELDNELFG